MKAVRLLEYGGQLVFNDVPTPTIARDEIMVKIKSTAVNHLDLVEASGTARQILPIDLPWIPGHEFSGVVEEIGSDVAAWAPDDAVFGTSGMVAYAEQLAVKQATIGGSRVIDYREAQFEKVLREKVRCGLRLDRGRHTGAVVPRLAISSLPPSPYRRKRPRGTVCRAR